jgi:hypothetical protein
VNAAAQISELTKENEELRRKLERSEKRVEELTSEVAALRKDMEKWKRGFRERSKRRTSRSERSKERPGSKKRPGRRAGHPGAQRALPERIDAEVRYEAPETCTCGGEIEATDEQRSTIVQDIPRVQVQNIRHVACVGLCKACKKKVAAPLPGDVPTGQSIAKVHVGPNLQAMCVGLRFQQKVNFVYCGAHVIREAKKIAELEPCVETTDFRDRVRAFYEVGVEAQKSGDSSARLGARIRLGRLIHSTKYVAFPDVVRLQERLKLHTPGVTRFLDDAAIPWHNNHSESDIRAIARFRAVTGGTRSETGSENLQHWMSVTQTRRKNRLPLAPFVLGVYQAHLHKTSPPSVFAP